MANRPPRDPNRLSATQIAELAVCEARKVREWVNGAPAPLPPRQAQAREQARQRGIVVHAAFHEQVSHHHNQTEPVSPAPSIAEPTVRKGATFCFIATQIYGPNHPRTWQLRRFRDRCLRPHALGRSAVYHYYRTAPAVARWLSGHRRLQACTRIVLDGLCVLLPSRTKE